MKKITQAKIAELAETSQSYISEILSGKKRPSPELARNLEKITGIDRAHWLYPQEYDESGNRFLPEPAIPSPPAQPEEARGE